MRVLTKIDELGKATAFYCEFVNFETEDEINKFIADGCIEITETDYAKLLGNFGDGENKTGYIYDKTTNSVISAPAKTAEEIKTMKKADIDSTYQPKFEALSLAFNTAILTDNSSLQAQLKQEYTTLKQEYTTALNNI